MTSRWTVADPAVARLVEQQMRNWELARAQHQEMPRREDHPFAPFVTISRSVGSGGARVATALGERLGWPVFDRQILTVMAGHDDNRRQLYESLDERDLGWLEGMMRSLLQSDFGKNDYFHKLTEAVVTLARQASAVFLGRGIDLILPRGLGLRVRVVAPLARRIAAVAARERVSEAEARRRLDQLEQERADFIRRHFRAAEEDDRYDLVVNLHRIDVPHAVDLIADGMRRLGLLPE
jgi:cytidylate kinase